MKKLILILMILFFAGNTLYAQPRIWDETEAQKTQRLKWWTDARFGMFIHWGIYAMPARHEWVKNQERLTTEQDRKSVV